MKNPHSFYTIIFLFFSVICVYCSDITGNVFGSLTDGMPAAFGDFNSDELTDVFVLRDEGKSLEIFLADEEEPLLRRASPPLKCSFQNHITSVVPGDFDGDALMDVLVTTVKKRLEGDVDRISDTLVYILYGGATFLNCTEEPIIKMIGQPLALDYNQDMIIDLFGTNVEEHRMFWIFNQTREKPYEIRMNSSHMPHADLKRPHSHAFLG